MADRPPNQWTEGQLAEAVAASTSWRGLMRTLGFPVTSNKTIRRIRQDIERLGIDTSHFRGKRAWSDDALRRTIAKSATWRDVVTGLGLNPDSGTGRLTVKAHAMRLGLDLSNLDDPGPAPPEDHKPDLKYLRAAATAIASSWFHLRGFYTALPIEPTLHDLLVTMPDGIKRVQVKTTTYFSRAGWAVPVSRRPYSVGNLEKRVPYDPELIDLFFIMDGDLTIYLIPSIVVAGRTSILLRAYKGYIVGNAVGLMGTKRPHAA